MTGLDPKTETALVYWALMAVGGYLLGSIPFGVVSAKLFKLGDLRQVGSGNIGATNVLRTGNKLAAVLTLVGDAGKGALAVAVGWAYGPQMAAVAGFAAIVGHVFPVWLKFRGGKGVATAAGVILAWSWPAGLLTAAAWLLGAFGTRISSVGALLGAGTAPLWIWLFGPFAVFPASLGVCALVVFKHQANIRRLLKGEELRFGAKKA